MHASLQGQLRHWSRCCAQAGRSGAPRAPGLQDTSQGQPGCRGDAGRAAAIGSSEGEGDYSARMGQPLPPRSCNFSCPLSSYAFRLQRISPYPTSLRHRLQRVALSPPPPPPYLLPSYVTGYSGRPISPSPTTTLPPPLIRHRLQRAALSFLGSATSHRSHPSVPLLTAGTQAESAWTSWSAMRECSSLVREVDHTGRNVPWIHPIGNVDAWETSKHSGLPFMQTHIRAGPALFAARRMAMG